MSLRTFKGNFMKQSYDCRDIAAVIRNNTIQRMSESIPWVSESCGQFP